MLACLPAYGWRWSVAPRYRYDPDHIRKGLLCMLDTDMNAEVVEAVAEAERAGAGDDD